MAKSLNDRINDAIAIWAEDDLIKAILKSLVDKGVVFAGNQESELAGSIEYVKGKDLGGQILANDYWYWVEYGRKPGGISKDVIKKNIERWVRRKGFVKASGKDFKKEVTNIAFLIARKIARHGYKGKKFLESAITDKVIEKGNEAVLKVVGDYMNEQLGDL